MKKLKIHINTLGPIKNAYIELAKVMIFTGASNLGKSYTNFLTYYVFNLFSSDRLKDFIRLRINGDQEKWESFNFSFTGRELRQWMEEDVKRFFAYLLNYSNIPCDIEFEFSKKYEEEVFNVKCEENVLDGKYGGHPARKEFGEYQFKVIQINQEQHIVPTTLKIVLQNLALQVARYLGSHLLGIHIRHAYLLPPGRASLLNESFTTQTQSSKTGMYDIFMRDFDRINNLKMLNMQIVGTQDTSQITNSITNLIEGDLSYNKENIILKMGDETEVPLSAAASSIKELSPLLLWMQTEEYEYDSMCIEEPEAHAHPDMQYQIADLLARCINQGSLMQITTHSDYLLARLNLLIRLHNLKEKNVEQFNHLCQEYDLDGELTLNKEKIGAYYFHKDKETNAIVIEKQDLKEGIPFTTFSNAVQKQMNWDEILDNIE